MQKLPLPQKLKALTADYVKLDRAGKDANNAANRTKTELRNAIKEYWTEEKLPIGSYMRTCGLEFRYEANETKSLDSEAVFVMFETNKITREQFLRLMKIDTAEAKRILGADVVADLEIKEIGDKLDVRITSLPVENDKDEFVMAERSVRTKIKRSVFGKEALAREAKENATPALKRRIKIRKPNE